MHSNYLATINADQFFHCLFHNFCAVMYHICSPHVLPLSRFSPFYLDLPSILTHDMFQMKLSPSWCSSSGGTVKHQQKCNPLLSRLLSTRQLEDVLLYCLLFAFCFVQLELISLCQIQFRWLKREESNDLTCSVSFINSRGLISLLFFCSL